MVLGTVAERLQALEADVARLRADLADFRSCRRAARVPMARRRLVVREHLACSGGSTRGEILAATGVPSGTLSVMLTEGWAERGGDGCWRLKEGA